MYPMQPMPCYETQTVKGFPLQPGERVVFFHHDDGVTTRIIFIVMGLVFLIAVFGLIFLIAAFFNWSETTAITTHRFIWFKGNDPTKARWIMHGQVRRITRVMRTGECRTMRLEDGRGQELEIGVVGQPMMQQAIMGAVDNPQGPAQWPSVANVQP